MTIGHSVPVCMSLCSFHFVHFLWKTIVNVFQCITMNTPLTLVWWKTLIELLTEHSACLFQQCNDWHNKNTSSFQSIFLLFLHPVIFLISIFEELLTQQTPCCSVPFAYSGSTSATWTWLFLISSSHPFPYTFSQHRSRHMYAVRTHF